MKTYSFIFIFFAGVFTLSAQNQINTYQYWFNDDYNSAVTLGITPGQGINLQTDLDVSSLSVGVHLLYIRFKDDSAMWSSPLPHFFYKIPETQVTNNNIIAYQYWFDNDYNNATTQPVTATQNLILSTDIDATTLNTGVHIFYIRFLDEKGQWSSPLSQFIYKTPETQITNNNIVAYRYWFDNDFANAQEVSVIPTQTFFTLTDNIDMTQMWKGTYVLHYQFKDSLGMWSSPTIDTVEKISLPIAEFTYTKTENCDSTIVAFQNLSIDGDTYYWDFGDGTVSTDSSASHVYYGMADFTVSLTVTDTTLNIDSTITEMIHITGSTFNSIVEESCDTFVAPSGAIFTQSGQYLDTITNVAGCDSIINIDLTINNSTTGTDVQTACNSYTWIDGNTYTSSTDTPTYTLTNAAGCDSVVTLNLTINNVDTSVTNNSPTLTANATGAIYQWLDCNNGNMPIPGETNQSFTAISNGSYAVEVTQNGCTDTSACITVANVSVIENNFGNSLTVYPNPTTGNFSIGFGETYENITVNITDINGKLLQTDTYNQSQLLNIEFNEPAGVYFVTIITDKKKALIRLVKK